EGSEMPRRTPRTFTAADRDALGRERCEHPDPRVQQRLDVVWLIRAGATQARTGQLAGVSKATVARCIAIVRRDGVHGVREFHRVKPTSARNAHQPSLEVELRERPPHTTAEAAGRIEARTGVRRKEAPVRQFRKSVSAGGGAGGAPSRCPRRRRSTSTGEPRPRSFGTG
ncbi:hypothetical protein R5W24_006615, partial [Gemmata sp. JC717]|uniref:helix-turn-helix domain-containing protein n=1 Tax=Gemmata algarum TaxID=2975278 RepID=UPI0021BB98EB